jgi:hypothetical protein
LIENKEFDLSDSDEDTSPETAKNETKGGESANGGHQNQPQG